MDVSLVVATYKRRKELNRLLRSLTEQTCKHFQVIIIDQNSCGYLDEVVGPYNDLLNLKVVATEPKGVSYARNLGLQYATHKNRRLSGRRLLVIASSCRESC